MKHHPDRSLKNVTLFSALVNLSAGARYNYTILFFRVVLTFSNIPAPSADNKRGGKLLSGPDRVPFICHSDNYLLFSSSLLIIGSQIFRSHVTGRNQSSFSKTENPGNKVGTTHSPPHPLLVRSCVSWVSSFLWEGNQLYSKTCKNMLGSKKS